MSSGGSAGVKYACLGRGNTSQLRSECPIYLANVKKFRSPEWKAKIAPSRKKKGNEWKKAPEVRTPRPPDDEAQNTGVFGNDEAWGDGENNVNFARRQVLINSG